MLFLFFPKASIKPGITYGRSTVTYCVTKLWNTFRISTFLFSVWNDFSSRFLFDILPIMFFPSGEIHMEYIATEAFGLKGIVRRELQYLGLEATA